MNTEKVAALKPDLIVAEWWPLEKAYSGFEANTGGNTAPVLALAPIVGITQGNSVVTMIEDYGRLAASLGVDLGDPVLAARKAAFEQALAAFKAAIATKPGLSVLAVWAGTDALYVAEGPPGRIVTPALVADVFGLACRIIPDPVSGSPMVVPLGRRVRENT